MTRPCEIIKSANNKTRTITYKKDYKSSFLSFDNPGHCVICRRAIKFFTDDKPFTQVDG